MRERSMQGDDSVQPAYIVSAYQRPDLLLRLLNVLRPAPISLHIDAKVDVNRFAPLPPEVTLLPRHICHWGLFGHVAASLEGLSWFMSTQASHAILLTGQCYPLVSQEAIRVYLVFLGDRSQMGLRQLPISLGGGSGGQERIDCYHVHLLGRLRNVSLFCRRRPQELKR